MSVHTDAFIHPCLRCGACCASYRASFYWAEAVSGGGTVPDELTRQVSPHHLAMLGTLAEPPRCVALTGTIGEQVACSIYELRPSPCREYVPSFENGERNLRCDEARLRHGLQALRPEDWQWGTNEPGKPARPRVA